MTETRACKGVSGGTVRLPPNWGGVSVASQERVTSGAAPVRAIAVPHPELRQTVDPTSCASRALGVTSTWVRRGSVGGSTTPTRARTSSAYRSASLMWRAPCESASDGIHDRCDGDRHVGASGSREHTRGSVDAHARHHARCSAAARSGRNPSGHARVSDPPRVASRWRAFRDPCLQG